ncbi:MAG: IS1 family transposase [Candidatus Sphingomonas colombiensis]|nr:IS1 family transposase [Sphingomonas sp.]WEK44903.1 MAG: IS1 family transposase [Sphingomonas sp.]
MNRLEVRERAQILHALCEGMSMRACERVFDRPLATVVKIVEEVGDMAIRFHQRAPTYSPRMIQVDELWSFVGRNDHGYKLDEKVESEGVSWTYLGVDPDTQLVLGYHVGGRHAVDAVAFMRKIASRLTRAADGSFATRPSIAFDGLPAYPDAVDLAFGDDVNAGVFEKQYDERKRYKGSVRKRVKGSLDAEEINTWRIERENGFMRQANRRFTRKSNGFSKRLEFHERQIAIWMLYRNYCWVPRPRRLRDGTSRWEKRVPGAMAAGLTDRVWTIDELVEMSDEFRATRIAEEVNNAPVPAVCPDEAPFWVNHSPYHRRAKVHAATCSTRKKALAAEGTVVREGMWRGFATQDEATKFAAHLEPDHHDICRLCLGSYLTLSTFGRRR